MLKLTFSNTKNECGTDEAGRGCLAGPVTSAVVLFKNDNDFVNKNTSINQLFNLLNDSKKLTEKKRLELRPLIEEFAIESSFIHILPIEIDEINILSASLKGMQECILNLKTPIDHIIVDGNHHLNKKINIKNTTGRQFSETEKQQLLSLTNTPIIKGDAKYLSIAAASILAKTYRDDYMCQIHEEFPMYNWDKNKGYPTKDHREAIEKYGITKYHRKSFRLLPDQLCFDF